MASGLAHEIRNPLTAIRTFVEYLPSQKGDQEFMAKFNRIVPKEIGRAIVMIRRLLEFSKPAPATFQKMDIHLVLEEIIEFLSSQFIQRRIKVVKEYQTSVGFIRGDPL